MSAREPSDRTTCPVCGVGRLADIAFDDAGDRPAEVRQTAESRELLTYSCGHEVRGGSVATADADALDVERRTSQEAAQPTPAPDGGA
jgi:hypothetical protein